MTSIATRMADRLVRLTLAFLALILAASCGSGAVSDPGPTINDPNRITILPATAVAYSGSPTTFVISGGTGFYIVTSSNQAVIPVAVFITSGSFIVVPNAVGAETVVTLSARDTGTTPIATATVTVRPGTVENSITITPSSSQGGSCAPAICSGGDAEVVATLSQGGIPIAGRGVRFEAISGDFGFITSAPGAPETLDSSVTVVSDQTGKARARIRVFTDAPNQTALLQVTDLVSGAFQRTSFVIAQATGSSPGFFVSPTSVTFQGGRENECASSGISATFYIFGGAPPYTVSNTSSAFFVSPTFVSSSGGSFTVRPNGTCVGEPGAPIIVRDSSGRTVTVTAANIPGTEAAPALTVTPETVTLSSCSGTASVTVAGGRPNPNYFVSSGSDSITASITGNTVTIRRRPGSPANAGPVNVGVSDGTTVANVTVELTGEGAGVCLGTSPTSVTLTSCSSAPTVTISGGTGTYTVTSSHPGSVQASVLGSVVTISRISPSLAFTPPATITVTDAGAPAPPPPRPQVGITVNASGAGAGACP